LEKALKKSFEQFMLIQERNERSKWQDFVAIPSTLVYMPIEFLDGFALGRVDDEYDDDHQDGDQGKKGAISHKTEYF